MKLKTMLLPLALLILSSAVVLAAPVRYLGHCGDKMHSFHGQKFERLKDCKAAAQNHKSEHPKNAKAVTCVKAESMKM